MLGPLSLAALVGTLTAVGPPVTTNEVTVSVESVWETRYESFTPGMCGPGISGLDIALKLKGSPIASATHYGHLRIESAKDDRGTVLRARNSLLATGDILNGYVPLHRRAVDWGCASKPGRGIAVNLAFSLPARDAMELSEIVGSLKLRTGSVNTVVVDKVKEREGQTIDNDVLQSAGITLTIREAPEDAERSPYSLGEVVRFEVAGNYDRIVSIGLVDEGGGSRFAVAGTSRTRDGNRMTFDLTTRRGLPENAALKISVSSSDEEIEVPIRLTNIPLPGSRTECEQGDKESVVLHKTKNGVVPVVYNYRFEHLPLSESQVEDLMNRGEMTCPDDRDLWFLYVTANWERTGVRHPAATVYFTPEEHTPRLRKGKYAFGTLPPAHEYWQVSRKHKPFKGAPQVPGIALLPFPKPIGFSEEEVIEIVDFVRTNPEHAQTGAVFCGSSPILSIVRGGDNIEVMTGAIQGMLAGTGQLLTCKKRKDGTFEVLSVATWVS